MVLNSLMLTVNNQSNTVLVRSNFETGYFMTKRFNLQCLPIHRRRNRRVWGCGGGGVCVCVGGGGGGGGGSQVASFQLVKIWFKILCGFLCVCGLFFFGFFWIGVLHRISNGSIRGHISSIVCQCHICHP